MTACLELIGRSLCKEIMGNVRLSIARIGGSFAIGLVTAGILNSQDFFYFMKREISTCSNLMLSVHRPFGHG